MAREATPPRLPDHGLFQPFVIRGLLWTMIACLTLGGGLAAVLLLAGVGDTTAWRIVVTLGGAACHCGAALLISKHARVDRTYWLLPTITMALYGVNFVAFVFCHWFVREEARAWTQTGLLLAATLLVTPIWRDAKRRPPSIAHVLVLALVGATLALSITMVWHALGRDLEKVMGSMWTLSVGASLTSFITQPTLKGMLPMLRAVVITMIVAASALTVLIIVDDDLQMDHFFGRLTLVACILALCGTGTLEAFRRLQGSGPSDDIGARLAPIELRCVVCNEMVTLAVGESACPRCSTTYRISLKPSRCGSCGYDMRQLSSPLCPECGVRYGEAPRG